MEIPKNQRPGRILSIGSLLSLIASGFFFWLWYSRYLRFDFNELGRHYDSENQAVYTDSGFIWCLPAFTLLVIAVAQIACLAWRRRAERTLNPTSPHSTESGFDQGIDQRTRNWDDLAQEYWALISRPAVDVSLIRTLIGRAASQLPRDNPDALFWFTAALQRSPQKWFVAKVMAVATPVPMTMLDPLLVAALLEPDPSATRVFVEPCVRGFGPALVAARVAQLAGTPGVSDNDGVQKVMYWVPRSDA